MSTIAFVTVEGGGNIPPTRAIAAALAARGHRVEVLGMAHQRAGFEADGFGFTSLDELGFWNRGVPTSVPHAVSAAVRLASSAHLADEVEGELARLSPDVVVVDGLMASSLSAATRAGHRTVALLHTFDAYWRGNYGRGVIGLLARLSGTSITSAWDAAAARLVTSDRLLDPAGGRPRAGTEWVGATERGVAAQPSPDSPPLVLVSLSTTWLPGQTAAYQNIATALGSLPVRGVITTGGLAPDRELELPPNVELRGRVAHAEIMRDAALVIGHGGHSTTFTALAHGLPLVIMPMHPLLDQPMVGAAVAKAGAGVVLKRTASPTTIARAVAAMLDDDALRARSTALGERLRATDPAGAAADAIERLAARHRGQLQHG
ncbi:nucleotide disphospho-sugar-binding domain-containing protein [Agromyces sp. NPDC049794]|uniref:glycosyltransferase n=1 Tax=unclassified Agromyces TaxID=2639701 RepID=UPI00340102AF